MFSFSLLVVYTIILFVSHNFYMQFLLSILVDLIPLKKFFFSFIVLDFVHNIVLLYILISFTVINFVFASHYYSSDFCIISIFPILSHILIFVLYSLYIMDT